MKLLDYEIEGSGGLFGGGGSTESDPNSLRSKATVKIVDLLGEGEILGLVDGGHSIYLDRTPLIGDDAQPNFKGLVWTTRYGLPDQTHIEGFAAVEGEVQVSTQVLAGVPVLRTINDPELDALKVTVRIPALYSTDDDNGTLHTTTVQFIIEVKRAGGSWVNPFGTITITGKCTSPYDVQKRLELPKAPSGDSHPWEVRVTRVTADSNDDGLQNDIYFLSYTTVIDAKFSYPNSALVALAIDGEQFGQSVPNRRYEVYGRIIKVPSNYNAVTRQYTGIWNGTFIEAYTNNPAWIFYDICTNDRFGLGEHINIDQVDKWSLYEIAQYCDEMVDDGYGGQEPRFTFNGVLSTQQEAYDALQAIANGFRGMAYWSSGAVMASQDRPRDPDILVTPANVINGKFSYQSSAKKARHTVAVVQWADPNDRYERAFEPVYNKEGVLRYGYKETPVTAPGCTSRGQAHRYGEWLLLTELYETQVVTYQAGMDHAGIRPGDIAAIQDPNIAQVELGGRLSSKGPDVWADLSLTGLASYLAGVSFDPDNIPTVRASTGFAQKLDGSWQTFANNVPRITDKGLLIEAAATNLLRRSSEFEDVTWGKTGGGTIAAGTFPGPTGLSNARKWVSGGGSDPILVNETNTGNISSRSFLLSVWAKADVSGAHTAGFKFYSYGTTPGLENVQSGDRFITNDWQRYSIIVTFPAARVSTGLAFRIDPFDVVGGSNSPAAGTSILFADAMLEEITGTSQVTPSTNIVTGATAVARPADLVYVPLPEIWNGEAVAITGWTLIAQNAGSVTEPAPGDITITADGTQQRAEKTWTLKVGNRYRLRFTLAGAPVAVAAGHAVGNTNYISNTAGTGTLMYEFLATGTTLGIRLSKTAGGTGVVTGLTLEEVTPYTATISYHGGAEVIVPDIVPTSGGWLVPANTLTPVPAERVTNGSFSVVTPWTGVAGAISITGGRLVFTAAGAFAYSGHDIALSANKLYRVSFNIVEYTSGAVRFDFGGGTQVVGQARSTVGTHTEYVRAQPGNIRIGIQTTLANTTLKVDNVSVMEVPDYQHITAINVTGPSMLPNTLTRQLLDQPVTFQSGKTYTYSVVLPDGNVVEKNITVGYTGVPTKYIQLASALDALPVDGAMWLIAANDLQPQRFKVVSIREVEPHIFEVSAVQNEPSKYLTVDGSSDFDPLPVINSPTSKPPTDLSVLESLSLRDNVARTTLTVSWKQPDGWAAPVAYSVTADTPDGKTNYGTVKSISLAINDVTPGEYKFFVSSINIQGKTSQPATITYTTSGWVGTPAPTIANLHLVAGSGPTEFIGKEPTFEWDNVFTGAILNPDGTNPFFAYNTVQVYHHDTNELLREERVFEPKYTYTLDRNAVDNAAYGRRASREVRIEVSVTDIYMRTSAEASLIVENPVPAAVVPSEVLAGLGFISVKWPEVTDVDFEGVMVWRHIVSEGPFNPDLEAPIYDGKNTFAMFDGDADVPYDIYVAAYDSFGKIGLNITGPIPVTIDNPTLGLIEDFGAVQGVIFGEGDGSLADIVDAINKRLQRLGLSMADSQSDTYTKRVEMKSEMASNKAEYLSITTTLANQDVALASQITALTAQTATDIAAAVLTEQVARTTADGALASSLSEVAIRAGEATASGLWKLEAVSAPGGVTVRLAALARVQTTPGAGATYVESGFLIDIMPDGFGGYKSRIAMKADQFLITNGSALTTPFEYSGGVAYIQTAMIRNLTALNITAASITGDRLVANTITASQIATNTITATQIAAGTITATQLAAGAVTASKISVSSLEAISATLGNVVVNGSLIVNGTIITDKIAANAVTSIVITGQSGSAGPSTYIQTASIFNEAGAVSVDVSMFLNKPTDNSSNFGYLSVLIYRNSTYLTGRQLFYDDNFTYPFAFTHVDYPSVGATATYDIYLQNDSGAGMWSMTAAVVRLINFKR